jgi:hypothetical protein
MSPIVLEFCGTSAAIPSPGPLGKKLAKNKHYAILWLYQLTDNKVSSFSLPIYKTNNPDRLIQNVVTEADDTMTLEKVGEVKFSAKYSAGLDESHEEFLGKGWGDHDTWSSFQCWRAARKSGEYVVGSGEVL